MRDIDRVIGKLEEFQEWSKAEFTVIRSDIKKLEKNISDLNSFKVKVYTSAGAMVIGMDFLKSLIKSKLGG